MKTSAIFTFCLIFCCTLLSSCNNCKNCVTNQVLYYYCPSNTFSQIWIPDSSNTYSVKNILDLRIDDNAYRECQTCDGLIEVTFRHPWQDNIIELTYEGDSVRQGVMWVCSDEIDPGREGYNSGQCVVPMNDIRQQDDTLYFTIDYSDVTFFSNAIGINIHSSEEAISARSKEWVNNRTIRKTRDNIDPIVNYRANIKSNSLSLLRLWNRSHEWSERSFYKIDKQELEKIPRTMPEKMERANAKDDSPNKKLLELAKDESIPPSFLHPLTREDITSQVSTTGDLSMPLPLDKRTYEHVFLCRFHEWKWYPVREGEVKGDSVYFHDATIRQWYRMGIINREGIQTFGDTFTFLKGGFVQSTNNTGDTAVFNIEYCADIKNLSKIRRDTLCYWGADNLWKEMYVDAKLWGHNEKTNIDEPYNKHNCTQYNALFYRLNVRQPYWTIFYNNHMGRPVGALGLSPGTDEVRLMDY